MEKVRPVYSGLKLANKDFDHADILVSDITMDLPQVVKEEYVSAINKLINAQGRLLGYLDDQAGKQVHHINLRSLGGSIKDINNFIVVYPKDHLNLHRVLSTSLNNYLTEHTEELLIYAKAKNEISAAATVLALNSDMSPEDFIVDFYNMSKRQSLNKLPDQLVYSDRQYKEPMKTSGPTIPHKIKLTNFISIADKTEISLSSASPIICSINAASEFLKKDRKDIRTILVKNNI